MKASEVIARARSQVGLPIIYGLGKGGFDPKATVCYTRQKLWGQYRGACDCSGFVAWCLGVPRKNSNPYYVAQNGGWFETSAVFADATSPFGFVTHLGWPTFVGTLLVYPDREGHQGHIGIVSKVGSRRNAAEVIHCSRGNFKASGYAIRATPPDVFFANGAINVAVAWVDLDL